MNIDFDSINSPFLDLRPTVFARDPLLHYHDGVFRCYYSAVERPDGHFAWFVDEVRSEDLVHWSEPRRLTRPGGEFSSPGNILRRGDEWVICVQTYPVPPGKVYADESARLWYMISRDLETWSDPIPMRPEGAQVNWSESHRQIDPCFAELDGRYYCFYKTDGRLGLLVSDDFAGWEEASPDRSIIAVEDTPGRYTVENPCVIKDGEEFVLCYSACVRTRGLGLARSNDLLHWHDIHDLDLPVLPWANTRPTAGMIVDLRNECGNWLMAYHAEMQEHHSGALALAWSTDLEHWTL